MSRSFSTGWHTLNRERRAVDTIETLLWENFDEGYRCFWDEARKTAVYRKIYQGGGHGTDVAISVKDPHPQVEE